MNILSNSLRKKKIENPFSNPQSREYSDQKVINEFQPTSIFWNLFNEQHELIIGSRGSGKTFLLKMMRYSMLSKYDNHRAKEILSKKEFIAMYVPMRLPFVSYFSSEKLSQTTKMNYFFFSFNCLLAESLIHELISISKEYLSKERFLIDNSLSKRLNRCWFDETGDIGSLNDLRKKVKKYHYSFKIDSDLSKIIPLFTKELGATLNIAKQDIVDILGLSETPKWIVCVDEAEFLKEMFQKSINSVFRGSTDGIIYKVATLPFAHKTFKTMEDGIEVSVGNDFNFKLIDMEYNSSDFVSITNKLCTNRLAKLYDDVDKLTLEDFVGQVGTDNMMDYYKKEIGIEEGGREKVYSRIIDAIDPKRVLFYEKKYGSKETFHDNETVKKALLDKLAPVFYVREMYKLSKKGQKIPGWYAGSDFIRRAAQGNPRLFLVIMNSLFDMATKHKLTPKNQHKVIYGFTRMMVDTTKSLEGNGPESKRNLDSISRYLKNRTHFGYLSNAGNTFTIDVDEYQLDKNIDWIHQSVAHNRLLVDEDSLLRGVNVNTKYSLANFYSMYEWIPIRVCNYPKLPLIDGKNSNIYDVYGYELSEKQLSLFEEENNDV